MNMQCFLLWKTARYSFTGDNIVNNINTLFHVLNTVFLPYLCTILK
jgi:hypothetical protein